MSKGPPKASKDMSGTASMAKQLADLQAMVKKLTVTKSPPPWAAAAAAAGGSASNAGAGVGLDSGYSHGAPTGDSRGTADPSEKQVKRDRIKKINELLKVYDGSSVASDLAQVKSLTEEKERLGKELDAERRLEDRVTSLATRLRTSRAKAKCLREEHTRKQLVIDELVAKQTVQDSLAEADAEVVRLEEEVQRLGADRAPPPTAGKPTLHELLPSR
eukprot:3870011-Pyramimonas_sp.AAC.1